eukprot:TRINITY_DN8611_c0_g1_i2.p1 TRINITY_DN8611_c0_g1~~TRINITY_DN8611_c0_g1_i2.p1  ORF type:complete len:167 (+),score=32.49 TRINITY_DN8611_c0_g1_i2:31-531(+)
MLCVSSVEYSYGQGLICSGWVLQVSFWFYCFFFSSRRRHTRCREVSWARRCVQETGINAEYMGKHPEEVGKKEDVLGFLNLNPSNVAESSEPKGKPVKNTHAPTSAKKKWMKRIQQSKGPCLLYTSDAADDTPCVDLGGRRIIKKKNTESVRGQRSEQSRYHTYNR